MYDTIIMAPGCRDWRPASAWRISSSGCAFWKRHTTVGGLNSFYRLDGRNYDVGLHAVTNYVPPGTKRGPLARVLRQLRLGWDDFALVPQLGSAIVFPGVELRFNNDFALLEAEVRRQFPRQIDALRRLLAALIDYDEVGANVPRSAREVLGSILGEPLLVEMLMCPVLFYGSAQEDDCDFTSFSVLFRSLFLEGFARPAAGVRQIIKTLLRRYKSQGGEAAAALRCKPAGGRRRGRGQGALGRRPRAVGAAGAFVGRMAGNHAAVRGGPPPPPA